MSHSTETMRNAYKIVASKCNYTDVNDMRMTTFDKEDIIIHMQKV